MLQTTPDEPDLVVIPLAFVGDRESVLYRAPPAPRVLVHDWIWRRRADRRHSVVVSAQDD